jgi:hypothetical protein
VLVWLLLALLLAFQGAAGPKVDGSRVLHGAVAAFVILLRWSAQLAEQWPIVAGLFVLHDVLELVQRAFDTIRHRSDLDGWDCIGRQAPAKPAPLTR